MSLEDEVDRAYRDYRNEWIREWKKRHPETVLKINRAWAARNIERLRVYQRTRYRAKALAARLGIDWKVVREELRSGARVWSAEDDLSTRRSRT